MAVSGSPFPLKGNGFCSSLCTKLWTVQRISTKNKLVQKLKSQFPAETKWWLFSSSSNPDDISVASLERKQSAALANTMEYDNSDKGLQEQSKNTQLVNTGYLPSCYYCLLRSCIVQLPPLMTHPWLQCFCSRLGETYGSLASTKLQRMLTGTSSGTRSLLLKKVTSGSCTHDFLLLFPHMQPLQQTNSDKRFGLSFT